MMANMIKALSKAGPQGKALMAKLMEGGKMVGGQTVDAAKGLGAAGKGAMKSGRLGMLENGMKTLPKNLGLDAQVAGNAIKNNPYGAAVLGGGAAAGGGGFAALLASLDDEDEDKEGY